MCYKVDTVWVVLDLQACWIAGKISHSCGASLLTHLETSQKQQLDCILPSPAQSSAQQQQQLWQHWEQLTTEVVSQPDLQPTMQPVAGMPCYPKQAEPKFSLVDCNYCHTLCHAVQTPAVRCGPCWPSFEPSCALAGHPDDAPVQSQPLMPPEAHQQQQDLQRDPGVLQPELPHAAHGQWQQQERQDGRPSADLLQRAEYRQQPGDCHICWEVDFCQASGIRSGMCVESQSVSSCDCKSRAASDISTCCRYPCHASSAVAVCLQS